MTSVPRKNPNRVSAYHDGMHPRENLWQATVEGWFREDGWLVYHTHDSRRSERGFPDLVCALPDVALIYAELKTEIGEVTDDQEKWLLALAGVGEAVHVWRPSDSAEIQELLSDCRVLAGSS